MSKSKNYPKRDPADLKQTIRTLKGMLKRERKLNDILKHENRTLKAALDETSVFLDVELSDVPVEDIVRYFSKRKNGKFH